MEPILEKRELSLMQHLIEIARLTEKTMLSEECFVECKYHAGYVAEKLEITELQAVLFSVFVTASESINCFPISNVLSHFNSADKETKFSTFLSLFRKGNQKMEKEVLLPKIFKDIDALIEKGLIRRKRDYGDIYYRVPQNVLQGIVAGSPTESTPYEGLDNEKLFRILEQLFAANNGLEVIELYHEIDFLLKENRHLSILKQIDTYRLHISDVVVLLCFCHLYVTKNEDHFEYSHIKETIDWDYTKTEFENNCKELLSLNLIERSGNQNVSGKESYLFSRKAKEELFQK